VHSYKHT